MTPPTITIPHGTTQPTPTRSQRRLGAACPGHHCIAANDATQADPLRMVGAANDVMAIAPLTEEVGHADNWFQVSPFGRFPHRVGMQVFDQKAANAIVTLFKSAKDRVARAFRGLPIFVGHPDLDPKTYTDHKKYGSIQDLEVRADGLYAKPKWSAAGKEIVNSEHYDFQSPLWNMEPVPNEAGSFRPVELISVGLTNRPNIPGKPVGANTTAESEHIMKDQLTKKLGLKPLAGADEVTDAQIQEAIGGLQGAANEKETLANQLRAANEAKEKAEREKGEETTVGSGLPVITMQPVPVAVAPGVSVTFSVTATSPNGSALTYQWCKGGVAIAGATSAGLTFSATGYGSYSVKVTNSSGTLESNAVTLTVATGGSGVGTGGTGTINLDGGWGIVSGEQTWSTADLGIREITRARASATTDTCTLLVDGRNVDAPALFSHGTTVTILRGGVPWFTGRVDKLPATASGSAQSQSYTLSGPWWYLEHLVFTQQWKVMNGTASQQLGRAILGMDINGNPETTGAVINEALGYAIAAGAPFVVGSVLTGYTFPFDEVKDVTCAEVIRKMLRWHPDAVAWFDYSQSPPAIHIQPRSALGAMTVPMGTPNVNIGNITPRYDLQAPQVVIAYETTGSVDGKAYTNVEYDAAPSGADGKAFGAVVLSIPLHGQSSASVKQPLIVTPIIDDVDDPDVVAFLVAQYGGELATAAADPSITPDGITITRISRDLQDPDALEYDVSGDDDDDGTTSTAYDDSLGNMLVQGSISLDMQKQFALKGQMQRITFGYTLDSGSGDSGDTDDVTEERMATLDIMATNAVTQPYTTLTSYDPGDTVPTGLAANFLATLAVLQWAGTVVLEEQLAGATVQVGLGSLLNISGSENAAWSTMNALIVQEQVQASTGRTTLTFGPAEHLSPTEMVARLRTTRPGGRGGRQSTGARSTDNSSVRSSGAPSDANTIGGGTLYPFRNATPVPGAVSASPAADFALYDASSNHTSAGGLWVGVKFGNVLPTSRSNSLAPYPSDYTSDNGYTYEFKATADGSAYIQVDYDTSGDTDNATTIEMGNGATVPADDGGTDGSGANGYLPVGTWHVDTTVTPNVLKILSGANGIGSQTVSLCGGAFFWFPA